MMKRDTQQGILHGYATFPSWMCGFSWGLISIYTQKRECVLSPSVIGGPGVLNAAFVRTKNVVGLIWSWKLGFRDTTFCFLWNSQAWVGRGVWFFSANVNLFSMRFLLFQMAPLDPEPLSPCWTGIRRSNFVAGSHCAESSTRRKRLSGKRPCESCLRRTSDGVQGQRRGDWLWLW